MGRGLAQPKDESTVVAGTSIGPEIGPELRKYEYARGVLTAGKGTSYGLDHVLLRNS